MTAPAAGCDIEVVEDSAALAVRGAELFRQAALARLREAPRFTAALSGGSTPAALYERLARGDGPALPWERIHLFWGDERHVPPGHPESNHRMVKESLLDAAAVPPASVHRIPAELESAPEAARRYEEELRSFFALPSGGVPALDLVLLGLGADGHTASLFPGSSLAGEREALVAAGYVESAGSWRISLTFRVLNAASRLLFLVSGSAKAAMVRRILQEAPPPEEIPAAGIRPTAGRLTWLLDRQAASLLDRTL